MAYLAICSNRPRPSTQKGAKGHQWWRRDVYHLSAGHGLSLCGRNSADWLVIGLMPELNGDCCTRCARATLTKEPTVERTAK